MGIRHSFERARKKIDTLNVDERGDLVAICLSIHNAQVRLTDKARPILESCVSQCQGLCCRNIHPADIITTWDLIYILAMTPQIEGAMADCLTRDSFFPADCIFLKNGTGPCLFPDNLRPERCIISFCRVEPSIQKQIRQVMSGFSRLIRFFMFRPARRFLKRIPAVPISRLIDR